MAMNAPMQCIAVNRHTPPLNSLLPPLLGQLSARPALWSAAETRSESARNGQKRPKIAIRGYRGPFIVVRDCSTTSSEATISLPASGLQQKRANISNICNISAIFDRSPGSPRVLSVYPAPLLSCPLPSSPVLLSSPPTSLLLAACLLSASPVLEAHLEVGDKLLELDVVEILKALLRGQAKAVKRSETAGAASPERSSEGRF